MKNNNDVAMTWRMRCLTRSVTIINATLQLLDIYIYRLVLCPCNAWFNRKVYIN